MREEIVSSQYKKQYKKVKTYPAFDEQKFRKILNALCSDMILDPSWKDHALKNVPKKLKGIRDIHVAPNIILLYRKTGNQIELIAIGSHSDLGLTEELNS